MKSKIGRNDKCLCGSGKKYKNCCLNKLQNKSTLESQNEWKEWMERVSKLPFRAEIISKDSSHGSIKVYSAKIIQDGQEKILFEDKIELSTNSINGDKLEQSTATLVIPQNNEEPKIKTIGNALVSNSTTINDIALNGNKKKLKEKIESGLFASVQIGLQRNTGQKYFQLFFGISGKEEKINSSGMKDRPHIDFYPSGNGKFIRLSDYKCTIESESKYDKDEKIIFPSLIYILIEEYNQKLEIKFTYEEGKAILSQMKFKNINSNLIN